METFADPKYRKATGRDLLPALREDPVQRNLVLMGLLLVLLITPTLAAGLHQIGVPIDWGGVAVGVAFGVAAGMAGGVALGVAFGVTTSLGVLRAPDYLTVTLPTALA